MGHARPFTVLQQRLGRKKVSDTMLRDAPVAYLAFDVLYTAGELLIDRALRERAQMLDAVAASASPGSAAQRRREETQFSMLSRSRKAN